MLPAIQALTASLIETLQGISTAAGFQTDPDVRYAAFAESALKDVQLVLRLESFATDEAANTPINWTIRVQTYQVAVLVRVSPDDPGTDLLARTATAAADVERALLADVTQGDLADNTELVGGEEINFAHAGIYGVDLEFRVRVRYPIDQPFGQ